MTRFSSPAECYEIFVGQCTVKEFMDGSDNTALGAVQVYCDEQWPWDEPCTDEIREALVEYVESIIDFDD